jgi:hypothetical protein
MLYSCIKDPHLPLSLIVSRELHTGHAPATLHADILRRCATGSTRLIAPVVAVLVVVAGWHHTVGAWGSLARDPAN